MRNRKSPCLTSETFLPLMVRNQILVLSFYKTLFFNKLLHGSKKPAGLITSPQTTDSCQPLWQLFSYMCLCSLEMEIASTIKVMGDCKKLSSGILWNYLFVTLGDEGGRRCLAYLFGLLIISNISPSLPPSWPSFPLSMFLPCFHKLDSKPNGSVPWSTLETSRTPMLEEGRKWWCSSRSKDHR